jgi:Fe-Mn family superoxide dismutase
LLLVAVICVYFFFFISYSIIMAQAAEGPFKAIELPWKKNALADKGISQETIEYHYGKHHQGYVRKLNAAVAEDAKIGKSSLVELIQNAQGGVFNNAAQIWNHDFYWQCLGPNGGGAPKGAFSKAIDQTFGSFDKFKQQFTARAAGHFGSGWVWLAMDPKQKNQLVIVDGHDAFNPLRDNLKPVMTIDVWEHAYYIDYRNDRAAYIDTFWKVVNWDFINKQYEANCKL